MTPPPGLSTPSRCRVELDNHYIKNWSPGLELRTLALTFAEVARFREERPATTKQPIRLRAGLQRRSKAGQARAPAMHETAEPEIPGRRFSRVLRRGCDRSRCAHAGYARLWQLRSRIVCPERTHTRLLKKTNRFWSLTHDSERESACSARIRERSRWPTKVSRWS